MKTIDAKKDFKIRKSQHFVYMIGTKIATGACLTKRDLFDIKKTIDFFKEIGNTNDLYDIKNILEKARKNRRIAKKYLTLI